MVEFNLHLSASYLALSLICISAQFLISRCGNQSTIFDVTKYGAIADGKTDSSFAFLAAWEEACGYEGKSILVVPGGTFFVRQVKFRGPCCNNRSPVIAIKGTLKAPSSSDTFSSYTWITFQRLNALHLIGHSGTSSFDARGESWSKNKHNNYPTSLKFEEVSKGEIRNFSIFNDKGFHINFSGSRDINVSGLIITSPPNGPNTDGIHIGNSANINITSSIIAVGDDCISVGPNNTNIYVHNVTCGPGHGISIGSLGKYPNEGNVDGVTVRNCTIHGTNNGLRIKTWPTSYNSTASNMMFEDIVMINVSNPIIVDQQYCPHHACLNPQPSLVKLRNVHFKNITGTCKSKCSITLNCSSGVPCENVDLFNVNLNYKTSNGIQLPAKLNVNGSVIGLEEDSVHGYVVIKTVYRIARKGNLILCTGNQAPKAKSSTI
ncbi:hypothetical protein LguiA_031229 [Lonicera macranthoides]